jgi:hypothetical protein
MGKGRGVYMVLVGRPECKRLLGRPRHRWDDSVKMDLRETGISGANWIWLAQDRVQWQAFVNMGFFIEDYPFIFFQFISRNFLSLCVIL